MIRTGLLAFLALLVALGVLMVGLWAEYAGADVVPGLSCRSGCRPMQAVLANRPIYPIHSFARPFVICEWPR